MTEIIYIDEKGKLVSIATVIDGKKRVLDLDAGRCIRDVEVKKTPEVRRFEEFLSVVERRYGVRASERE